MARGITEATVEEIKQRIDLADLISSYGVAVRQAGASKKACCPFHQEKTPSFNINEAKGFYHCFGCGESGDAIKFVQKMEGLSFVEAVRKLAAQCGIEIEEREDPLAGRRKRLYALMAELAAFYCRCLKKLKEAETARKYLVARDLGEEAQETWTIGYAPAGAAVIFKWAAKYGYTPEELEAAGVALPPKRAGDSGYHRFGGRLMFAIRDKQGRVVGFSGRQLVEDKRSGKYVNSPETPIFKKGSVLFGFDRAAAAIAKSPRHEVIVCEGQIDCIRLHLAGFANSVAGQGTAFTEEHVKMLKRVTDAAVLVYDDDAAGHKATVKSARLLLAAEVPVRVVSLPNGDDPDSFLRAHPADDFRRMLDGAESIMSFQVRAERAKEANPDSVDGVNRVVKEVLATIACAANAVQRASMVAEAAGILKIPSAALAEELEKVRAAAARRPRPQPAPEPVEDVEDDVEPFIGDGPGGKPVPGVDAAKAIPPPPRERAFCAFLLANECAADAKTIDGMLGEFLPPEVFVHPFTRAFVETWRTGAVTGEDVFAAWGEKLSGDERNWFDAALAEQQKAHSASMETVDVMQDFVRFFWQDRLNRVRGELPAAAEGETARLKLRLAMDAKRFTQVRWPEAKALLRAWRAELAGKGDNGLKDNHNKENGGN